MCLNEALPSADEHQVLTWKDATLRELLTTLRDISSPSSLAFAELKHPLARFSFKALYADSSPNSSGHKSSRSTFKYTTKELGMVYSRDILGEPGSFSLSTGATTAPRLLQDEEQQALSTQSLDTDDTANGNGAEKAGRDHDKTLEHLRFVPGGYMLISIILPKSALTTPATAAGGASTAELSIKGANATQAGGGAGSVGWKNAMRDVGRERDRDGFGRDRDRDRDSFGRDRDGKDKETGRGANSSNWRGGSDPLTFVSGRGGRGRGARGGRGGGGDFAGRDRDFAGRDTGRDRTEIGRRTDVPHLLADQVLDPSPAPVPAHLSLVDLLSLDVVDGTLPLSPGAEVEPIPHPDEADEVIHPQSDVVRGVIHLLDEVEGAIPRLGGEGGMIRLGGLGVLFRDEVGGRGVGV
ncbi:hypothetical protein BKA70DRAFT_1576116 [Coprinopsis sp. MPI-PUGE-AT-0042]|nr:hypothetical protein BKA70DRAFT_1576116 [Coprinopsis sp. MPI-PUGE-AT-0042]